MRRAFPDGGGKFQVSCPHVFHLKKVKIVFRKQNLNVRLARKLARSKPIENL